MNERIKQLAEQANTRTFINEDGSLTPELHKFAELIVKECSQMAHNSHPDDLPFVGGKMLVHFGVE
jgi:hypothetical protein